MRKQHKARQPSDLTQCIWNAPCGSVEAKRQKGDPASTTHTHSTSSLRHSPAPLCLDFFLWFAFLVCFLFPTQNVSLSKGWAITLEMAAAIVLEGHAGSKAHLQKGVAYEDLSSAHDCFPRASRHDHLVLRALFGLVLVEGAQAAGEICASSQVTLWKPLERSSWSNDLLLAGMLASLILLGCCSGCLGGLLLRRGTVVSTITSSRPAPTTNEPNLNMYTFSLQLLILSILVFLSQSLSMPYSPVSCEPPSEDLTCGLQSVAVSPVPGLGSMEVGIIAGWLTAGASIWLMRRCCSRRHRTQGTQTDPIPEVPHSVFVVPGRDVFHFGRCSGLDNANQYERRRICTFCAWGNYREV